MLLMHAGLVGLVALGAVFLTVTGAEALYVTKALMLGRKLGFNFEIMKTSFYLGRRNLISTPNTGLPDWQEKLYIALAGFAIDPSAYFKLPPNRVVEVGEQVVI